MAELFKIFLTAKEKTQMNILDYEVNISKNKLNCEETKIKRPNNR